MTDSKPAGNKAHRIALYLPTLRGGGAERAMLDIARGLTQRGLSVDLVLVRSEGHYLELVPKEVNLIDLHSKGTATALPRLIRYLRQERPDTLLSTLSPTNIMALLAGKLFFKHIRVIVRQANTFSMKYVDSSFTGRMKLSLEKYLWPFANAVVANSQGVADDIRQVAPSAAHLVKVILNPVVWPDHAEKAAMPVDHPWFKDAQIPILLSAGSLTPQKDHSTLFRAFAEVVKSRPARLVMLGEGADRGKLIALAQKLGIADVVDLPGFHLNPFAYMAKASVFALSSVYEGFPNVLVQSMACGTPVVSTDCPHGPREILEDGKWGRLVPVGDWQSLAEAILETLDHPVGSDLLIARANQFSAESSLNRYMNIVRAQCSQP